METVAKVIGFVIMSVGILFLLSVVLAFPVKWLWNWLMPVLFSLKTIIVWQAWGLNLLCGLLFRNASTSKSSD